ncbi:MAG: YDG domain-containing protein [Sphaerochaeta sp.]|nr:YDG domain-containing protein [Sphaerochaeta sp.]
MKHVQKNLSVFFVVLAALLLVLTGCGDKEVKAGVPVVQVEAQQTIKPAEDFVQPTVPAPAASKTPVAPVADAPKADATVADTPIDSDADAARFLVPVDFTTNAGVIIEKPLTVKPGTTKLEKTKVYDGTPTVTVTDPGTLVGVIGDDDVTLGARAFFSDKLVGTDKGITVEYFLTGRYADNYKEPDTNTQEYQGSITRKALGVYAETTRIMTEKPYDGTDIAFVLSAGVLDGVVDDDEVILSTRAVYQGDVNAGEDKGITVSYAIAEGADKDNYIAPEGFTLETGVITPLQLTIARSSLSEVGKTYDGTTALSFSTITPEGFQPGEMTVTATAAFADKGVGTDKAITVSYALETYNANYLAPVSYTIQTGVIEPKQLSIGAPAFPSTTAKPYDGKNTLPVSKGTLGGVVAGDKVTVDALAQFADKEIGDDKKITVLYTIGGPDAGNYLAPVRDQSYMGSIGRPKLSISNPILGKSKVYDSSDVCKVTAGSVVTGIVGTEDVQVLATATYDTKNAGTDKSITVRYSLAGSDSHRYNAPDDHIAAGGTIEKKKLFITDPSNIKARKEYDGNDSIEFTMGKVYGLYGSDGVEVKAEGRYLTPLVGTDKFIKISYSLSGPADQVNNYEMPGFYFANTGVITRKVLTVKKNSTVIEPSRIYDGTLSAKVTNAGILEGVVTGNDVTLEAKASFSDKNVGLGKSISVEYFLTGPQANNYVRPPVNTTDYRATITKRDLNVKPRSTKIQTEKPYDGTSVVSVLAGGTLEGVLGNDEVILSTTAAYQGDVNAGEGKSILVRYTLAEGADKDNYNDPAGYVVDTAVITPIQLTIAMPSLPVTSKVYDGTAGLSVTSRTADGFLPGTMTVIATAAYADKNVGSDKAITVTYALEDKNANYLAPVPYTTYAGVVKAKQLNITTPIFSNYRNKTYDGSDSVAFTKGNLIGVVAGDTVTADAVASYADKNVGVRAITVAYSLKGPDAANYITPSNTIAIGKITAKQLTISAPTFPEGTNRAYNGRTTLPVTIGTVEGVVSGDSIAVSALATYADKDIGSDKTITVTYSVEGPDAGNYLAPVKDARYTGSIATGPSLSISNPIITVSKEYDGTDVSQVTPGSTVTGIVGTEDVRVVAKATYDNKDAGTDKTITVRYTLAGSDSQRYMPPEDYIISGGTIEKKKLSITAPASIKLSKEYDGSESVDFTMGRVSGLYADDGVTVKADGRYLSYAVGSGKTITISYFLSGPADQVRNYTAPEPYNIKTGVITKRALTVQKDTTIVELNKIYDGTLSAKVIDPGTLEGAVSGDDVTLEAKAFYGDAHAGTDKRISVEYWLSGTDAGNYIAPVGYSIIEGVSIERKQLVADLPNFFRTMSKTYDGTTAVVVSAGSLIGIVGKDTVSLSATAAYESADVGEDKMIKVTYQLAPGYGDNANYIAPVAYTTNAGTIKAVQLTIDNPIFWNTTKSYDGETKLSDSDFSIAKETLTGLLDDEVTLSATASFGDAKAGKDKRITLSYSLVGTDQAKANYLAPVPYTTDRGLITPAQLAISEPIFLETKSKVYDGSDKIAFTRGNLIGVMGSDEVEVDATAAYASKNIGERAITVVYSLKGPDASNYIAPPASVAIGMIAPKQLTIGTPAFPGTTNKPYDGNNTLPVSKGVLGGVVAGDKVTVDALAVFADKEIGGDKKIMVSYTIGGPDADNYLAPVKDVRYAGSITMPKLVISDPTLVKTKEYDSSDECQVIPGGVVTGIVGREDVQVLATATFDNKDAGTDKTITVRYSLAGSDSQRYIAPDDYVVTGGTIEKRRLSVADPASIKLNKQYDGTDSIEFTMGKVTGLYADDGVEVKADGRYLTSAVGTDKYIKINYSLSGSAESVRNYAEPEYYYAKNGVITKKVLTVKKNSTVIEPSKTYDGTNEAKVVNPGILLGVVSGDEVTLGARAFYGEKYVGTGKSISVEYYLTGPHADNYLEPSINTTDY